MLYTPLPKTKLESITKYKKGKHELTIIHTELTNKEKNIIGIENKILTEDTLFKTGKTFFLVQRKPSSPKELRNYAATPILKFKEKYADIAIIIPSEIKDAEYHTLIASLMAAYTFETYKTEKTMKLKQITIYTKGKTSSKIHEKALSIAKGLYLARDIANMPPSDMNPLKMEKILKLITKKIPSLKLKVLDKKDLEKKGMNGILAVGKGSSIEPRLFILEYDGKGEQGKIALIGKAVTFDSGGLDLKPRDAMDEMKYDKSGGALVIGLIVSLALLKINRKITAVIPAVENMPGPSAYKPRDIIKMYNGKTVEITNTDAEGRMILADALTYAARDLEADTLIDAATLTGAVIIALGNEAAGLFGTEQQLMNKIIEKGKELGEKFWILPLYDEYREHMKSKVADLVNSGGREAGASLAAIFLKEFTDGKPWIHIDIAGVAWVQRKGPKSPMYPDGATGYGLETLIKALIE